MRPRERLRVGIDISRTVGEVSGVGRYAAGLVRGLAAIDPDTEYLLYPRFLECVPPDCERAWVPPQRNFRLWMPTALDGPWSWRARGSDHTFGNVDIVHSTAYAAPSLSRARLVMSVHDLSFASHPQFHIEANRSFCLQHLARAVAQGAWFLVPSQATKDDLQYRYRVPDARVAVIPYAAADDFTPARDPARIRPVLQRHEIEPPFLLFVGTLEPRKNLDTLLRALAQLSPREDAPQCQLVIAGPAGWLNHDTHRLIDELGLRARVRFTGYVTDEALRVLYSAAEVFVYPSKLEGFGLPVLEAMACGTPVITSNTSALPEVVGDAALLVSPDSVEELRGALLTVLTTKTLAQRLRTAGLQRAAQFSWQETARKTLAIYRLLANGD